MWIDLKGSECQLEECGLQKIAPWMDTGEGGPVDMERDKWGQRDTGVDRWMIRWIQMGKGLCT